MKRAEELYVLIKNKLFGEVLGSEVDVEESNLAESESQSVQQLNDRFAIRDELILKQRKVATGDQSESIDLVDNIAALSVTEVAVESTVDTGNSSTHSSLIFRSVFGSKEGEPPLTNWNGEFKGYVFSSSGFMLLDLFIFYDFT
jgi:hypothetical protein